MNCINLKFRTRKGKKYLYCKLLDQEILFNNCNSCENKEYKIRKHNQRRYKHKLTKHTEIPLKVKKEVWERDNHRCIYCHTPVPLSCANSHYIKRSQLGLGISQNIVCACPKCHYNYDFGINIQLMKKFTREYLKSKYEVWNEDMLKYRK